MKINKVFEGLANDSKGVYYANTISRKYEISIGENGFVMVKAFDNCGKLISPSSGAGGFSGNLKMNDEWKLKREYISWNEALQCWIDGKDVIRELEGTSCMFTELGSFSVSRQELINGKWYLA